MVAYKKESPLCSVTVGVFMCTVCLGVGVAIGYFAINKPSIQISSEQNNNIPVYQTGCNARCAEESSVAASCSPELPRHYLVRRLKDEAITVDGRLDDDAWAEVPWTENFMDIRGRDYPAPPVETKVKIRWDKDAVYVGAYLEEPHVWATHTRKDSKIYEENAFEVFFDVDASMSMYKEIEINALGTTLDIMLSRAYTDGGTFSDWDGVREKAAYTDGVVNNASVPATFWSVEMSIPFTKLNENTTRTDVTATDGEMWFMMLARPRYDLEAQADNTYQKKPGTGASWYSWSPTGALNLHLPSKWGLLFFVEDTPGSPETTVSIKRWLTYQALFDIFNALKVQTGTYVDKLKELDLPLYVTSNTCLKSVNIDLSKGGFHVTIESKSEPGVKGHITQGRHVTFTDSK